LSHLVRESGTFLPVEIYKKYSHSRSIDLRPAPVEAVTRGQKKPANVRRKASSEEDRHRLCVFEKMPCSSEPPDIVQTLYDRVMIGWSELRLCVNEADGIDFDTDGGAVL
jgi:hypothetical protein